MGLDLWGPQELMSASIQMNFAPRTGNETTDILEDEKPMKNQQNKIYICLYYTFIRCISPKNIANKNWHKKDQIRSSI